MRTESFFWLIVAFIIIYSTYSTETNINNTYGYKDEEDLPFTRMVNGQNFHVLMIPVSAIEMTLYVKIAVVLLKEKKKTEKELQVTKIQNHFLFWSLLFLKVVPPEIWKTILVVIYECLFRRTYFFGW